MERHWSLKGVKLDTITKGRIGYNLLEKELLKRDWEIYLPLLENTKIDCIILKNQALYKLQIKLITPDKTIPVRKISHNQGEYKVHRYTADEIDYFIGVDADNEDIYIVPIKVIENYRSSVSINSIQEYKNNFTQLEPITGNSNSGADDIGESLTGNTEGTE